MKNTREVLEGLRDQGFTKAWLIDGSSRRLATILRRIESDFSELCQVEERAGGVAIHHPNARIGVALPDMLVVR